MKDKIIIIGGGDHAKVVISNIKKLDKYEIVGYTDLINKELVLGVEYLGNDEVLNDIIKKHKNCKAVIGVGCISVSNKRQRIYDKLKEIGFDLPVIISKNAIVNEEVTIGDGTVVLEGAIINVGSIIGKGVIVNTSAIVEHNCKVGDFVHLTAGAILGGGVTVGDNSMIGVGAIVIQYKKICDNCLIGAGTVVTRDILITGSYFGIPAKKINL